MPETTRVFHCRFCQVRHFIDAGAHPSLLIEPRHQVRGELVYVPYWRVRGMALVINDVHRVEHRLVDTSLAAVPFPGLPVSLGLRAQAMRLRFAEPGIPGRFLRPELRLEAVRTILTVGHPGAGPDVSDRVSLPQSLIGDIVSLVHAPMDVRGDTVLDALSGREADPDLALVLSRAGSRDSLPVPGFLPAMCPVCGWDLEGPADSLALVCRQCQTVNIPHRGGLQAGGLSFLAEPGSGDLCLPVWEVTLTASDLALETFADLIRLTNLPMVVRPEHEARPLVFRIPAFKVNPPLFLRLAAQLTLFRGDSRPGRVPIDASFFPVTLPAREAFQASPMVLAHLAPNKRQVAPLVKENRFKLRSARLVHVPFSDNIAEYLQWDMNVSIQKQALIWGRGL
ncbi:MAG: hypothetical protein EOM25_00585 [Deltaproteobacteria bacterium]|nr:hypothetical protein [Deltaproteobacteria bacterium]